jgi:hypothetical protein
MAGFGCPPRVGTRVLLAPPHLYLQANLLNNGVIAVVLALAEKVPELKFLKGVGGEASAIIEG